MIRRALPLLLLGLVLPVLAGLAACRPKPPQVSDNDQVQGPLGGSLHGYLTRLEALGFSGAVLVAKDGQVVLNKGYGLADRARRRPFTAGTMFDIASISKQFTAAAILCLEEEGKLKVEDPVSRFFPQAAGHKGTITLHMLLTHTAGFPETIGDEYEPVSRDEAVRRILDTNLLFAPGHKFHYSNVGYSLLAAVVEAASGQPYETYLREHLWEPAGMRHTGFHVADRGPVAHGYTPAGDWGTPLDHPWAADGPYWNLRGNGGILTTTADLYRWHLALQSDLILPEAERKKLTTPFVPQGPHTQDFYGYGWDLGKSPTGGRLVSHVGGNLVFDSDVRRYLDDKIVLIAGSNSDGYSAIAVTPHLQNRLFGKPDPEPPAAAPADPAALARRAGRYALPSGDVIDVRADGGRLAVTPEGPAAFALLLATQGDDDRRGMAERLERSAQVLDALRAGNPKPYAKLHGLQLRRADAEAQAVLAPWQARLGAWQGAEVLGNESSGGHPYTYARLTFARGSKLAEFGWSGPGVETFRIADAPRSLLFVAQADGAPASSFATYDVRTGTVQRLTFDDGAGGALVVHAADGRAVQARRAD